MPAGGASTGSAARAAAASGPPGGAHHAVQSAARWEQIGARWRQGSSGSIGYTKVVCVHTSQQGHGARTSHPFGKRVEDWWACGSKPRLDKVLVELEGHPGR